MSTPNPRRWVGEPTKIRAYWWDNGRWVLGHGELIHGDIFLPAPEIPPAPPPADLEEVAEIDW
jgi:hypothetical protein